MARRMEIAGKKYGRLTAVKFVCINNHHDSVWLFKCDCGRDHVTAAYAVTCGKTRSCGCLKDEMCVSANITHGQSETRIYRTWNDMRRRCRARNRPDWANYGERGITVCKEWEDFDVFYKWAMDNGYNDMLTIDRIRNNEGYSPNNCRWVTRRYQNNNTRANHQITAFGKTQNLQQWADETGFGHTAILFRLKSGWTVEEALTIIPIVGANQNARTS